MEAQAIWVLFPAEIAVDLRRDYGIRIADWHQGQMSSYEMLELLEFADDDGAFKTALREGEPSRQRQAVLQIANEIAVLRAGMVPDVESELYGSRLFIPDKLLREQAGVDAERTAGREAIMQIGARTTRNDDE